MHNQTAVRFAHKTLLYVANNIAIVELVPPYVYGGSVRC